MTSNHDQKVPVKSGEKVARACPDNELKAPKKKFSQTSNVEAVLLRAFFPGN